MDEIRPEVSTPGRRTVFDEYSTMTIQCKASLYDFEAVDIQRNDGRPLPSKQTRSFTNRVKDDVVMTLVIDSVALDDGGVYLCLGYNENKASNTEVNINITGKLLLYCKYVSSVQTNIWVN